MILHLFPDTNLFVQCLPLEELDWSILARFEEVHLIVSRPVQKEIDNQKNKGNNRISKRARKYNSTFRDIILRDCEYKIIRAENPCVKVFIRPKYTYTLLLSDKLNYQERDDQLVGTVYEFMQQHPDADARLLTHDTGPMATATMVGVAVEPIPDNWLMPPEKSEDEKKISALSNELARIKKTEPLFLIECLDNEDKVIERLEYEYTRYRPLNGDEIASLMKRIEEHFPAATDFGTREQIERKARNIGIGLWGQREVFKPVTDEEIASYKDDEYPRWLEECGKLLHDYHHSKQLRQRQPMVSFVVMNTGTRPGKDALITIEASGNFRIRPPADETGNKERNRSIELPAPPKPPRGQWLVDPGGFSNALRSFEAIGTLSVHNPLSTLHDSVPPILHPLDDLIPQRDPNAFYWKPERPIRSQRSISLECAQWRHGTDEECFEAEVYFDTNAKEVSGVLECRIQAENLSDPMVKRIPVRILVRQIGIFEMAECMVSRLIASKK